MKKVPLLSTVWHVASRAVAATVIAGGLAVGYDAYTNNTVDQNNLSTKVSLSDVEKDGAIAGGAALLASVLTAAAIRRRHNGKVEAQVVAAQVGAPPAP